MPHRTLIACLGNIFLGDDGFGVEVARRLAGEELPAGARLTDYGIRGMHLAYDLAEGWDTTILVDTADRGGKPGTVYVIRPERAQATGAGDGLVNSMLLDPHGMQPDVMLGMAGTLGAEAGQVLVVGCQPACLDEGMGLSAPVAAAVDEAAQVVLSLVHDASREPASGDDPPGEHGGPAPVDDQNQPDGTSAGSDRMTAKG
jgi:hydrogenase maturation protease